MGYIGPQGLTTRLYRARGCGRRPSWSVFTCGCVIYSLPSVPVFLTAVGLLIVEPAPRRDRHRGIGTSPLNIVGRKTNSIGCQPTQADRRTDAAEIFDHCGPRSSHALAPAADRSHDELGGVADDPDADEAGIGGHIVHAIRHDLGELLILEIVDVHAPRIAFRAIIGSAILDLSFLLGRACGFEISRYI